MEHNTLYNRIVKRLEEEGEGEGLREEGKEGGKGRKKRCREIPHVSSLPRQRPGKVNLLFPASKPPTETFCCTPPSFSTVTVEPLYSRTRGKDCLD